MTLNQCKYLAITFRYHNQLSGHGGVVVIDAGKVLGWMDTLRDPETWASGCIAIDEHGNGWIAKGGNDDGGAESWQPI